MAHIDHIMDLDAQYYMSTFGQRTPVAFTHGQGCTLFDTEGKSYTDCFAGIAVNALGYAHPRFTQAVQAQVGRILHCSNIFYNAAQAELAQKLVENSCADRVFIANSGAEANEGAIKLARKYAKAKGQSRYQVICADNSFHGRTLATLAATGQQKYQAPFTPLPTGFVHVPYGDSQAVEAAITPDTCAVLLECIQGEGGVIEGGKAYLQAVRKLCDDHDLLLIFDEVQTGMGRTGALYAYQLYGVEPDVLTLAKALGNGVPIGAVLCKEKANAFAPGDHGSTFGGNPLACTAALAVLHELLDTPLLAEAAQVGAYLKTRLEALAQATPMIKEVRGRGLLLGMELAPTLPANKLQRRLLEMGYIVGTAGRNTLRLAPPLIITQDEVDSLVAALTAALAETAQ